MIILFFLIGQHIITRFGAAYPCNLIYINCDRQVYYIDDKITLNASWDLNYDPGTQISYIIIQIFNSQNINIWESPHYDEIGIYEGNWTIDINSLNISLSNSTTFLYIKLFLYFFDFFNSDYIYDYLQVIQIQIIKRDISYQISGFNNQLNKADNLDFFLQFFIDSLENITYVVNQTVSFELIKNDLILYTQIFTSNEEGIIHVSLKNITEITNGSNKIKIFIDSNPLFNALVLEFDLFIDIDDPKKNDNDIFYMIMLISIISGIGITIFIYASYKRSHQKPIAELTVEI
jgi:hypothetical protein